MNDEEACCPDCLTANPGYKRINIMGSQSGRVQTGKPNYKEVKSIEQLQKEAEWLINSKNIYIVNVKTNKIITNLDQLREAIKDEN
jgi:hypothetical protein